MIVSAVLTGGRMVRILVAVVLALALPLAASAAAVVESVKGTARAGQEALMQGMRFVAPTSVATAAGSQVTLKFDDGMQIVLDENSLLRVLHFRHAEKDVPDGAVFELLSGAARVVTGRIAADHPRSFLFRLPQTQLTVERPADFSVVLVNPAYIVVHSGAVTSYNGSGTTTLAEGSTTVVETDAAAPAAIAASAMPPSAVASLKALQTASVGVPAGASAAGAPPPAVVTPGTPGWVVPAILVGVGVAAALAGGGGGGGDTTSTTNH
jgi:FecR protein